MKKPEVLMLVTGSLFEQVFRSETLEKLDSFAETITPAEKGAEWKEFLPTAEGIITSWGSLNEMTEEVLDQAPELKIIGHAAGSARTCARLAIPRGIIVTNAAPAIARSVAEYCLGMTIACLRSFPQHDKNVNYPHMNAGASCFDEGPCCTASPQASIRAVPTLLHNVLVLWVSAEQLSNVLTISELVLLSNHDLLKPHTNCQRTM